jgi:hypothetical protein
VSSVTNVNDNAVSNKYKYVNEYALTGCAWLWINYAKTIST